MQPLNLATLLATAAGGPSAIAVLALNLLPVLFVPLFGWSAGELMLLYWVENLVIGAVNVLKMLAAAAVNLLLGPVTLLFFVPFFVVHYGLFCMGHGHLVMSIAGTHPQSGGLFAPFAEVWRLAETQEAFKWNLAAVVAVIVGVFLFEWLPGGAHKRTTPIVQMFAPYGRIVVLHLALLGGLAFVAWLGQPVFAVLLLALGKTVLELGAQAAAKKGIVAEPPSPPPPAGEVA